MAKPNTAAKPLSLFVPICKVDEAQRLVYGSVTREEVDAAGEILDYETAKAAFESWSNQQYEASDGKSYGNMRAMHGSVAAGKFVQPLEFDDEGKEVLAVGKVVDDAEWAKVVEGVYTGFSIGGSYQKRWADPDMPGVTRYTPIISEISIVDNPCVRSATFDMVRSNGAVEMVKFKKTGAQEMAKKVEAKAKATPQVQETTAADELVQVWKAKDGSTHPKKADALRKNAEIDAQTANAATMQALDALNKAIGAEDEETSTVAADAGSSSPAEGSQPPAVEGEGHAPATAEAGAGEGEGAGAEEETPAPAAAETTTEAPATEEVAKAAGAPLNKSLYDINRCADLLCDARWLGECLQSDVNWGQGNPELAAEAKAAIKVIADLLVSIVGHEAEQVTKRAPSAQEEAVSALEKATMRGDALQKVIDEVTSTVTKLTERLEKLEQQPLPAKGAVRVVEKGATAEGKADLVAELAKMSDAERTQLLIKAALRSPQQGIPA